MSRRFLVNRNVNPAGGVNPPIQPNIGQYGWTSSDAAHVNQLISYVDVAREYAERTQLHADYVRDAMRDFIEPTLREIKVIHTHLVAANNGWTLKYEKFQEDYADFLNKYNVFQNDLGEFKTTLADINVKYLDIQQRHMDIRTKHTEVEENTKKVEDIYSEMKDGQVYRGIWNPEGASAYPDPENTNSSWDVVLRDDLDSVVFDNKTWQTGNRLIWIKADNAYTQIKTTTQVTSVNGKSGAVTLTHSDVGAISASGGTATGAIESPEFKAPLFGQYAQHTMFKSKNAHLKVTDGTTEYGVYSEANKPSAADVRALPISGGTTTGKITVPEIWTTNGGHMTAVGQSGSNVKIGSNSNIFISCPDGGSPYLCSNVHYDGGTWSKHNPTKPSGLLGIGAADLTFYKSDASSSNPLQHKNIVYHTGNKPTAADVGAVGWRQVNATGNGVTYTRLASLPANVGSGSAGMTLLVSGGSNFGATYIPSFVVGFSTRGYTGSGAHPSGTVLPVCLTGSSDYVMFYAVTAGDTVELWMRRNVYSYTTAVALLQNNSGTLLVDQTVGSLPTGTVTEFAPILNYTTSNKPTAADVGAMPSSGISVNDTAIGVERSVGVGAFLEIDGSNTPYISVNRAWRAVTFNLDKSVAFPAAIYSDGNAVYHAGFKPTAADVGAVNKAGDTMTGSLVLNHSDHRALVFKSTNHAIVGIHGDRHVNYLDNTNMSAWAWRTTSGGTGVADQMVLSKTGNLSTAGTITENGQRVYSPHNKPTAADVGALPVTGGTINGNLTVSGQLSTSSINLGIGILYGARGCAFIEDHGNGNTTISASKTSAGTIGDLYVGYNDNQSHSTDKVILCRNLRVDSNHNTDVIALDGSLYDTGQRVYSPNNKPTAKDIEITDPRTKEVSSLYEIINEMRAEIETLKAALLNKE